MPLELRPIPNQGDRRTIQPGDKGFLVLAKVRAFRSVNREAFKKFETLAELYFKEKCPELVEKESNGAESEKQENGVDNKPTSNLTPSSIRFQPHDVYDNCSFFLSNLPDPTDFAHFFFNQVADHPDWPQPKFPLRIMPVEIVCRQQQRAIETAVKPMLERTFGGDESYRFSFILHTRKPSSDMTLRQAEAIIRNCLWSVNPNCVQCLKYQDFAIMVEIIDSLVLVGIAKDFNQLGRYNTATSVKGRDLKEQMEDSEDDISDDPNLSDEGNVKRKIEIKRKRRLARIAEAKNAKEAKMEEDNDDNNEVEEDMDSNMESKEEVNGQDE